MFGKPSWNKGTKGVMKPNRTSFKKGQHASPETEFKKGETAGEKHRNWRGGRNIQIAGYINVYSPWHPKVKNAKSKYVFEHILVMEKHLGRYLNEGEIVHHINKNKQDNRIENLKLFRNSTEHLVYHNTGRKGKRKHKQVIHISNLPKPVLEGDIVTIQTENWRAYISVKCPLCGKLFWKQRGTRPNATCSKYCGGKKSVINRRRNTYGQFKS